MDYVNLDIHVIPDSQEENSYLVTASTTGRNKKTVPGRFSFSAETWQSVEPSLIALGARDATRDHAQIQDHALRMRDFGKHLFNCLINGAVRSLYDDKRQDAVRNSKILRLRLILAPLDLVVLPWEILFDERHSEYLCLTQQPKIVLIRSIDSATHKKDIPPKYAPPLHILGVIADPRDLSPLRSELERKIIDEALQQLKAEHKVDLEWKSGTISEFDDLPFSTDRWEVFHFTGHGRFEETSRQGQLAFEDEKRRSKFISTQRFIASLPPATKLVVLNACETARGNRFDRLSNIAHSLATQKIPAVVAMQFQILDAASNRFSKIFYMLLARGTAVDEAVAEARREIYKTAEDQDRLDWAAPILYISSSNIISFKADQKPERKRIPPAPTSEKLPKPEQAGGGVNPSVPVPDASSPAVTLPLDPDKTTSIFLPEQEGVANPPAPVLTSEPPNLPPPSHTDKITVVLPPDLGKEEDPPSPSEPDKGEKNVPPPTDGKKSPGGLRDQPRTPFRLQLFIYNTPRRIYISIASIIIFILVLGSVFVLPSLLSKPSLFPTLCSGNFQSANAGPVLTPATSTSSDGEPIGLSEGATIFDLQRTDQNEVQYKLQAAQAIRNNPQAVPSLLKNALSIDQTDAEAQIYLENWQVLASSHPHITIVIGVSFVPSSGWASRGTLQGAFTAQKECNDYNQQDDSKTQIVLMIANIGGDSNGNITNESAKFVTDQIVDQAPKDPTIVGIMGWPLSPATIDVQQELQVKGSNLPILAACSSSDDLTGSAHFFRVCPADKEHAKTAANFLLKTKQKKKIAILYQSASSFTESLKNDFAKDIPNNMVGPVPFTGGDSKTIQDALNNVLAQNPDAIFFAGYASDLVKLLNASNDIAQPHNLLIMGGNALASTHVYPNPLPDLHNVYFTAFASPNQWTGTNLNPPFFQEYQANFGTLTAPNGLPSIDTSAMLGYDALLSLFHGTQQVLSTKNTINASDLEVALKKITGSNAIQGISGRIAFDSNNGDQDELKMIFVEHIEGTSLVIDEKHGCLLKDNCNS